MGYTSSPALASFSRQFDPDDLDLSDSASGADPLDYVRFALGALRRRKFLAIGVFLACMAVVSGYFLIQTRLYRAETRILVQRQQSLPSFVRSSGGEDQPTRGAWETIHRRENLIELLRIAGLLEESQVAKPRTPTWLDGLLARDDDPVENLVKILDRRLHVEAGEVTVSISLEWPDPQEAYRIVDGALQNFLEARHVQEVTAIDEAIATLRGRAEVLRGELDQATDLARRGGAVSAARIPRSPGGSATSSQLVRLQSMLEAKERAIGDVESFRRRRLSELQAQYESRRSVFASAHPDMVTLRQDIEALTQDSPQIIALRAEERPLRAEYEALLAQQRASLAAEPGGSGVPPSSVAAAGSAMPLEQNERVREARSRFQEVMESVSRAQLDLDNARAAFRHRYKVIWPVQVPRRPVSPNPLKVFGIGGIASLLLAFLAATVLDATSGRVLEQWQIERGLRLPVIADLRDR